MSLFLINGMIGIAVGIVFVLATPLFVALYSEPRLAGLTPFVGMALSFSGFQTQLQVMLARTGRAGTIMWTDIAGQVAALATAVVLALAGAGYLALAGQLVMQPIVMLVARWRATGWRLRWFVRRAGTFALVREGKDFGLAGLISFAASNTDAVAIGAALGSVPLGLYNRATQMSAAPVAVAVGPLTQVVVPAVNRHPGGPAKIEYLRRLQQVLCLPVIALLAAVAGTANILVPVALGPEWVDAVPIVQILALGAMFFCLTMVSYWAMLTLLTSNQTRNYIFATKGAIIASIVVAAQFGVIAVAATFAVWQAIPWVLGLLWLRHYGRYPIGQFMSGASHILLAAIPGVVGGAVISGLLIGVAPAPLSLGVALFVSVTLFAAMIGAFPAGRRDLTALIAVIQRTARRSEPTRSLNSEWPRRASRQRTCPPPEHRATSCAM